MVAHTGQATPPGLTCWVGVGSLVHDQILAPRPVKPRSTWPPATVVLAVGEASPRLRDAHRASLYPVEPGLSARICRGPTPAQHGEEGAAREHDQSESQQADARRQALRRPVLACRRGGFRPR